nr:hypothetical protein [Tanacetum cinerariifolium]
YANVGTPKDMFKLTPTLHRLDKVLCFVPARWKSGVEINTQNQQ